MNAMQKTDVLDKPSIIIDLDEEGSKFQFATTFSDMLA